MEDTSDDDEETIAKEEEYVRQELGAKAAMETESAEVAALCAEADASIDNLIPLGYLEHLQRLHENGVDEVVGQAAASCNSSQSISSRSPTQVSCSKNMVLV